MRTAIDRLSTGIENEIDILDFDGYKASNRFVCPECGEYVFPAVGKKIVLNIIKAVVLIVIVE